MKPMRVVTVAVMVAMIGLFASGQMLYAADKPSPGDVTTLQVYIQEQDGADFKRLDKLNSKERLRLLRDPRSKKDTGGISGFYVEQVRNILSGKGGKSPYTKRQRLDTGLEQPDVPEQSNIRREYKGLIGDFQFVPNSDDDTVGRGHLSVDVKVFTIDTDDNSTTNIDIYHWEIEVEENGFKVQDIVGSGFEFPPDAWDRIRDLGLERKLSAKGLVIKVKRIFRNGTLIDRTDSTKPESRWYESTPESCIDLLFKGSVPTNRIELEEKTGVYCMGRCDHPKIINTP